MIDLLPNLSDHVVAARITGDISADEFDAVIRPALATVLERYDKANVVLVLTGAEGTASARGLVAAGKLSLADLRQFHRLALVSDLEWVARATGMLRFIAPCSIRRFGESDWEEALQWVDA